MRDQGGSVPRQDILEQAAEWFVEFRTGNADVNTRARFDQWLRASPDHVRAYIEIARTYVDLPRLVAHAQIDVDALIARARTTANVVPFGRERSTHPLASRPGRSRYRIAAMVMVAGAAVALLCSHLLRYPTYATDIGESRTVTLTDGSTIDLNARSQIRVRFSSGERDVDLIAGQALFQVAKDPQRPFIVHGGAALVRAVGTQFDVNRRESNTTVTVIEGRVAVLSSEQEFSAREPSSSARSGASYPIQGPAYVSAGEQIVVTARAMTHPKVANVDVATGWIRHRLVFSGSPLDEVVEAFNRYNQRQILIEEGALNGVRVSGVYTSTDPSSFIRFLREQPGIEVTEDIDTIHVSRK